ncbi:MAG: hypothetical protein ACOCZW_04670 [Bacteroidota bacterium]
MDKEQLIYEFLDGTLSREEEQELYAMISSNEDMQAELKQQLALKNAVKSDKKAFTPKAENAEKIFSELGFTGTGASSGAAGAGFFTKYGQGLIAGAASSILTFVAAFLLFQVGENGSNKSDSTLLNSNNTEFIQEKTQEDSQNMNSGSTASGSIPLFKSEGSERENSGSGTNSKDLYSASRKNLSKQNTVLNLSRNEISTENAINDVDNNSTRDISAINNGSERIIMPAENYLPLIAEWIKSGSGAPRKIILLPYSSSGAYPDGNGFNNDSELPKGSKGKFSLEVRGSEYSYNNPDDVYPDRDIMFNNSSVALVFDISDGFSLAADYRRENFFQEYTGTDDGRDYAYSQIPNFETFALAMRYYPGFLCFSGYRLYLESQAGINDAGPVLRLALGNEFGLSDNLRLLLSLDYSRLWFHHDSESGRGDFISDKPGVHIGVKYYPGLF